MLCRHMHSNINININSESWFELFELMNTWWALEILSLKEQESLSVEGHRPLDNSERVAKGHSGGQTDKLKILPSAGGNKIAFYIGESFMWR